MTTQTILKANTESIDLYYYISLLWKERRFIAIVVAIVTSLSIILALSLPKKFSSTAVLLPPGGDSNSALMGLVSSFPIGGFMSGNSDETNSIIAILKSRTLLENMVQEFDLIDYYGVDNKTEARILLSEAMLVSELEEGTIGITFHATTNWFHPDSQEVEAIELSYKLAQYCIAELDRINKSLKTEEATYNRKFVENRYIENTYDLNAAEDSLKSFQEQFGLIKLEDQVSGSINTAINLQEKVILMEIEMRVAEKTLSNDHPTLIGLRYEISELKNTLKKLEFAGATGQDNLLLLPLVEIPELGLQWLRLMRDVEIQNQLFTFLTQQYEEAKLKEARDTPTVQLLDAPIRAEIKTSPQRTRMVIVSLLLSAIVSIVYVLMGHSIVTVNSGISENLRT